MWEDKINKFLPFFWAKRGGPLEMSVGCLDSSVHVGTSALCGVITQVYYTVFSHLLMLAGVLGQGVNVCGWVCGWVCVCVCVCVSVIKWSLQDAVADITLVLLPFIAPTGPISSPIYSIVSPFGARLAQRFGPPRQPRWSHLLSDSASNGRDFIHNIHPFTHKHVCVCVCVCVCVRARVRVCICAVCKQPGEIITGSWGSSFHS